jgi:2-keto-4-pentenoate hydratase
MPAVDTQSLAGELIDAYARRQPLSLPFSSRDTAFDLPAAYAVEAELARRRRALGHATVGRKVGFANKAMWRVLKLETLVWAHMYDDTVTFADRNRASLSLAPMISPKIEPEVVFKLKQPLGPLSGDALEAAAVLQSVEWLERRMAGARLRDHRLRLRGLEVPTGRFCRSLRPSRGPGDW